MRRTVRSISALAAALVLTGCASDYGGPVIYSTSIVNDSDSVFIMSAPGPFVVPPHSLLSNAPGDTSDHYVLTLYSTDCIELGQVELTQAKPQAYIDAGGHLGLRTPAQASAAPKPPFETDTTAGQLIRGCDFIGWWIDVRNDSAKDILVNVGYEPPIWARFRAHSRATLMGYASLTVPPNVSISVYDASCTPIGEVELSPDLEVLFVDASGHFSTEKRAVYFEGLTAADLSLEVEVASSPLPCPSS